MKPTYRSLPDQVYQHLLDEIVRGVRPAGSKLTEETICSDLEVSRTPAREALMLLHRDGLIDRVPRRGCFVKAFDTDEMLELFECREWVEPLVLKHSFSHIAAKNLVRLEKKLAGKLTERSSLDADDQLHTLIIDACPNRPLAEFARQLLTRTYPIRFWRTYGRARLSTVSTERLQIVKAIRTGDKATARRLLQQHIARGRLLILKLAGEQSPTTAGS